MPTLKTSFAPTELQQCLLLTFRSLSLEDFSKFLSDQSIENEWIDLICELEDSSITSDNLAELLSFERWMAVISSLISKSRSKPLQNAVIGIINHLASPRSAIVYPAFWDYLPQLLKCPNSGINQFAVTQVRYAVFSSSKDRFLPYTTPIISGVLMCLEKKYLYAKLEAMILLAYMAYDSSQPSSSIEALTLLGEAKEKINQDFYLFLDQFFNNGKYKHLMAQVLQKFLVQESHLDFLRQKIGVFFTEKDCQRERILGCLSCLSFSEFAIKHIGLYLLTIVAQHKDLYLPDDLWCRVIASLLPFMSASSPFQSTALGIIRSLSDRAHLAMLISVIPDILCQLGSCLQSSNDELVMHALHISIPISSQYNLFPVSTISRELDDYLQSSPEHYSDIIKGLLGCLSKNNLEVRALAAKALVNHIMSYLMNLAEKASEQGEIIAALVQVQSLRYIQNSHVVNAFIQWMPAGDITGCDLIVSIFSKLASNPLKVDQRAIESVIESFKTTQNDDIKLKVIQLLLTFHFEIQCDIANSLRVLVSDYVYNHTEKELSREKSAQWREMMRQLQLKLQNSLKPIFPVTCERPRSSASLFHTDPTPQSLASIFSCSVS